MGKIRVYDSFMVLSIVACQLKVKTRLFFWQRKKNREHDKQKQSTLGHKTPHKGHC